MGSVTVAKVIALVLTFGFSLNEMARNRRPSRDSGTARKDSKG